ncbi:MAG: hypothetical protein NVS9B3_13170 [Gemmatimonadaceae bacterium]
MTVARRDQLLTLVLVEPDPAQQHRHVGTRRPPTLVHPVVAVPELAVVEDAVVVLAIIVLAIVILTVVVVALTLVLTLALVLTLPLTVASTLAPPPALTGSIDYRGIALLTRIVLRRCRERGHQARRDERGTDDAGREVSRTRHGSRWEG